jgi:hypothetical protein
VSTYFYRNPPKRNNSGLFCKTGSHFTGGRPSPGNLTQFPRSPIDDTMSRGGVTGSGAASGIGGVTGGEEGGGGVSGGGVPMPAAWSRIPTATTGCRRHSAAGSRSCDRSTAASSSRARRAWSRHARVVFVSSLYPALEPAVRCGGSVIHHVACLRAGSTLSSY